MILLKSIEFFYIFFLTVCYIILLPELFLLSVFVVWWLRPEWRGLYSSRIIPYCHRYGPRIVQKKKDVDYYITLQGQYRQYIHGNELLIIPAALDAVTTKTISVLKTDYSWSSSNRISSNRSSRSHRKRKCKCHRSRLLQGAGELSPSRSSSLKNMRKKRSSRRRRSLVEAGWRRPETKPRPNPYLLHQQEKNSLQLQVSLEAHFYQGTAFFLYQPIRPKSSAFPEEKTF